MQSPEPRVEELSELLGAPQWITDLARTNPAVAEGIARFVEVAARDGAVPANLKLLYMAVIAAAKGERDLLGVFLARAIEAGLSVDQAHGAAAALILSRGIPGAAALIDATRHVFGDVPEDRNRHAHSSSAEDALGYVLAVYGEVPPRVQLMIDELPGALEAFHTLRSAGLGGSAGLSRKHAELLLVALNSALHEPAFAESHVRDARDEGASERELAEAVAAAIPLGGMAAWSAGASAIESAATKGSRRATS